MALKLGIPSLWAVLLLTALNVALVPSLAFSQDKPEEIQRKLLNRIYLATGVEVDTLRIILPFVSLAREKMFSLQVTSIPAASYRQ